MLKRFLMKKMMSKQMQGVPDDQQEALLDMIEKNPELFQKIATETQAEMKAGKDQQQAAMAVMMKYADEIKEAFGDSGFPGMPGMPQN